MDGLAHLSAAERPTFELAEAQQGVRRPGSLRLCNLFRVLPVLQLVPVRGIGPTADLQPREVRAWRVLPPGIQPIPLLAYGCGGVPCCSDGWINALCLRNALAREPKAFALTAQVGKERVRFTYVAVEK